MILLVSLLLALGPAAEPLPRVGYVDLARLVAAHPSQARVAALRAEAARLRRAAAAELPSHLTAAPEATEVTVEGGFGDDVQAFAANAAAVELSLIREALAFRTARQRQQEQAGRSRQLQQELWDLRTADREQQRRWERAQAERQQIAAIEAQVQLDLGTAAPPAVEALNRELTVIAELDAALLDARLQQLDRAHTRRTRQAAATLYSELDRAARAAERSADIELTRRAAELDAQAELRERMRAERLQGAEPVEVDLQLEPWRARLGQRPAAQTERRSGQATAFIAAAERLEREADELAAELADRLPARLTAFIDLLARDEGVELRLEPAEGVPDVTDQVAARMSESQRNPFALEPSEGQPR